MKGDLVGSNHFPWLTFGITDTPPSVEEISALVRRPDSSGFVAVVQPTEFPFAIVEWRTFCWLLSLARDHLQAKSEEAAQRLRDKPLPPNFISVVNGAGRSRLPFPVTDMSANQKADGAKSVDE